MVFHMLLARPGLRMLAHHVAAHCQLQAATRLSAVFRSVLSVRLVTHVFQPPMVSAAASASQTHVSTMARLSLLARHGHQLTISAQHAHARSTHLLARSSPSAQLLIVQPSTKTVQLSVSSTLLMVVAESADQLALLLRRVAVSRPTTQITLSLTAVSLTSLLR